MKLLCSYPIASLELKFASSTYLHRFFTGKEAYFQRSNLHFHPQEMGTALEF